MSEITITRFLNRWKPTEYIHIEPGKLTTGPIEPGWLSAQWQHEPVPGTSFVRLQNVWKLDQYLHIERGVPEAGPIGPGWLSAQWQFEEVPGTPFVRMRTRWPLIRYAHIEGGQIDVGHVEPGWLSAHWVLERVQGTSFVRLRNRWKPDQGLHIESGVLSAGPVEPRQLSAQWLVEQVAGTRYVRFKNRWKPDHYFHIEGGRAAAGPIQPGWLSAQWLREPVQGTQFVSLRNRWEIDRYLHIERGVLEVGIVEPGWLSAQWLRTRQAGTFRSKTIPLSVFQRKFDEFVNLREEPLVKFRLHGTQFGKSELTVFFEDPVDGVLKQSGKPTDLRDDGAPLEIDLDLPGPGDPLPNPNFHFNDLNTERMRLNLTSEPAGSPPEITARLDFETKGTSIFINNFPNVKFTGLNLRIKVRLTHDAANGLVALATDDKSVIADASVDVRGIPDGVVARKIESKMNEKVLKKLREELEDHEDEEGVSRPGLNRRLTRLMVGGDYDVVGVRSDGRVLTIDYVDSNLFDPFPENLQPPLDPGRLANIDHIVVLMLENRSFDHMLGYLSKHGGRTDVDGLRGGEKNRYKGRDFPSFPLAETQFRFDPCHNFACVKNQVNGGKMDGFVADFAARHESAGADVGAVMGYHEANQLPVYDALAREFLICQRWFCSHPGPTFPNRFYTLTGRLNRVRDRDELDNPDFSNLEPVFTKTIFDHLTAQGVTWRYYEYGYCFLRLFERYVFDDVNIPDARDPANGFFAAAQKGTLPSVSFIDPDFIDVPPGTDDHPPTDIGAAQHLVGEVVRTLMNGPLWKKTLLVITYDEHGGFYDHVVPPDAPAVSAGIREYGPRVPAFVVSPWVDRGKVTDVVFDHTSILKTIARRFLSARPPDLGVRMAQANDLSMIMRSTVREDKPEIPVPPVQPPRDASFRRAWLAREARADDDDFHKLLRTARFRFFVG